MLHHVQPLHCHHGRQSSSTSAELSQYLPTSPHHSRQNSSKSPPIPPRRPYISMTSPSSNTSNNAAVVPPTLLKLSPNSIGLFFCCRFGKELNHEDKIESKMHKINSTLTRLNQLCAF